MASLFQKVKAKDPLDSGIVYQDSPDATATGDPWGGYSNPDGLLGGGGAAFPTSAGRVLYEDRYSRYYDGAQLEPYDWDDGRISNLQSRLVGAGFLSAKSMVPGVWDPASMSAYEKALTYANMLGVSVEEVLSRLADGADAAGLNRGGGGGGGGLGAAAVTDEDIIALANKVAQGVLGRNLRQDEIGNFIPAFRGTLASGTSPQVSAENLIRQDTAPAEAGAHDVGNVMGALSKMLGG